MGGDEGAALGMPSVIWWGDLYPAKSKLDFRSATLYCTTISRLLIHKSSPNRTGLTATSRSTFDSSSHPSSISAYGSRFIAVVSSIIFVSTARITHHASPITHHHHDTYTKSSKRYRKNITKIYFVPADRCSGCRTDQYICIIALTRESILRSMPMTFVTIYFR